MKYNVIDKETQVVIGRYYSYHMAKRAQERYDGRSFITRT
jgi:hypothetical protein